MVLSDRDGLCAKLFVTGWAFMECLLFGGLLLGWGSLAFVLKTENIYADMCPSEPRNTTGNATFSDQTSTGLLQSENATGIGANQECIAQEKMLTLCFTIGSALFCIISALLGHVNFKFGTRVTRILSFLVFITGSLMMSFTSKETPWLMFPGLTCLGIGGLPLLFTNVQVSKLFAKGSSVVIGLLSGALDSSSAVMLVVKIASENGFSRQNMFFVITALHAMVLISTFFFLPKGFIKKRETDLGLPEMIMIDNPEHQPIKGRIQKPESIQKLESDHPSLLSCIKNPMYITHVVWLCLLQLRFFFFLGTLNHYLSIVLHWDVLQVSYYTNICYYTMMGGLVSSFFSGFIYDWQKSLFKDKKSERYRNVAPAVVPQGIASLLAVALSILVFIPNPQVLYVTFIVLTVFRSFLYSLATAFIGEVFPGEYFGILYCLMIICGGIFGFLQYALFVWAEAYEGGSLHINIFLLALVCLSFIHPLYLLYSSWKEERNS